MPCGRSLAVRDGGEPDDTPDAEAVVPDAAVVPDDRPGAAEEVACAPNAAEEVEAGAVEGPVRRRKARLP